MEKNRGESSYTPRQAPLQRSWRIVLWLSCLVWAGCQAMTDLAQGIQNASPPATPAVVKRVCRLGSCTQSASTNQYGYFSVLPAPRLYFEALHTELLAFHVIINGVALKETSGDNLDECHPDGCAVLDSVVFVDSNGAPILDASSRKQTLEKVFLVLPDKLVTASTVIAVLRTESLNVSLPQASRSATAHLLLGMNDPATSTGAISTATAASLTRLRTLVRGWAVSCGDGSLTSNRTTECVSGNGPSTTSFGDMTLFSGLSCVSGETARCRDVERSQDTSGRWWRNPHAVHNQATDAFSRDQTLGLLNYFLSRPSTTKGEASAWMAWVDGNKEQTCTASTDTRCLISPDLWALIGQVMGEIGASISPIDQASMFSAIPTEDPTWLIESETNAGFELHLVGLAIMTRRSTRMEGAAGQIAANMATRQPLNPFYAFLYEGKKEHVAQMTLAACPATDPLPDDGGYDWAWQRDQSSQVWQHAMGWDCIFMVNLLLGPEVPSTGQLRQRDPDNPARDDAGTVKGTHRTRK